MPEEEDLDDEEEEEEEEEVVLTLCERFRRNHLHNFCKGALVMSLSYLSFFLTWDLISGPNRQISA
jgi:hypothetical protein